MRLVPRFSLRFLLIALTIFLIVFGVGVKYWKREQAHQEYMVKLKNNANFWLHYEDEELKLAGWNIGNQLTGLYYKENTPYENGPDLTIELLLRDLPNPGELRRLGLFYDDFNRDKLKLGDILPKLRQCTALERLQLHNFDVESTELQELGALQQLRILDLTGCKIPAGGLAFLEQLPHLEVLRLRFTGASCDELVRLKLPRLRVLDITGCAPDDFKLTRDGWGALPALETLILNDDNLLRVSGEAGALPNLRHLDLNWHGRGCEIDWEQVAAAAPQLEALALHVHQYGPEADRALQRLPHLKQVHFCINTGGENWAHPSKFDWIVRSKNEKVYFLETQKPLIEAWLQRAPQVRFYSEYSDFLNAIAPADFDLAKPDEKWPSEHWNQRQVGLF